MKVAAETLTDTSKLLRGLAREYYFDPGIYARELEQVFLKTWQCVGHVSEFPEARSYKVFPIAGESIAVVRQDDGSFKAFHNHCIHRGHPLLEGSGKVRGITCRYHGWTYNADGSLRRAAQAQHCKAFGDIASGLHLKPVRLEAFLGFVFINCDPEAAPIADWLGGEADLIREYLPNIENHHFVCETGLNHNANWKVSVENYNECYHCPLVHSSSLAHGVLDITEGYTVRTSGAAIFQEGAAQTKNEKQYDYDVSHGPRGDRAGSWFFFPNFSIVSYPGGFLSVRQWLPEAIDRTVYLYRWFGAEGISDDDVRALMKVHAETTGAEDGVVTNDVYRGMASRFYEPGPLVTDDAQCSSISDNGVAYFQKLYRKAMTFDA